MQFFVPLKPITANHIWRNYGGRMVRSGAYNTWEKQFIAHVPTKHERFEGDIELTIEYFISDNRRRDLDNMLKGAIDACTHAGIWNDDSQIMAIHAHKNSGTKESGIRLTITNA